MRGPPAASPDEPAARYWAAAARGRLEIQRCAGCTTWIHFPEPACPRCGCPELRFEEVSGLGRVETFTIIHRAFAPEVAPDVPYPVAFVELNEQPGLRVFADIVAADPARVRIGLPVEVTFTRRREWGIVPSFRPRTASPDTGQPDEEMT